MFWGEVRKCKAGCAWMIWACVCMSICLVRWAGRVDRAGGMLRRLDGGEDKTGRLVHVVSFYVAVHTRGACVKSWIFPFSFWKVFGASILCVPKVSMFNVLL